MIAERVAGVALLAYPREVRESRGGEMIGTLLDVSKGSWWQVIGESLALIRSGLRARASITAGSGGRRLAASVCAQAATAWGLVLLIEFLRFDKLVLANGAAPGEVARLLTQALIAASAAAALVGYDRLAALFGFAWIGVSLQQDLSAGGWPASDRPAHVVALLLVPLACYAVMLLMPRARPRDARRLLWLAATVLLGLAPSLGASNTTFGYGLGLGGLGLGGMVLFVLLVAGLFLAPAGSSLPLAFALALVASGLSLWTLPGSFPPIDALGVRSAMIIVGPLLLAGVGALRLVSARRRLAR